MLKPAFSKRATISPVRLRRVASGLMMESVRSTAMGLVLDESARLIAASESPPQALRRARLFRYDRTVTAGCSHVQAQSLGRDRRLRPQPPADGRRGPDRRRRSRIHETVPGGDFLPRLQNRGFRYLR